MPFKHGLIRVYTSKLQIHGRRQEFISHDLGWLWLPSEFNESEQNVDPIPVEDLTLEKQEEKSKEGTQAPFLQRQKIPHQLLKVYNIPDSSILV